MNELSAKHMWQLLMKKSMIYRKRNWGATITSLSLSGKKG
jgi:hypothetical protein